MRMYHFQAQNDPFVMNKNFLVQTIITFMYLLALFIVQNLKKFLQWIFGPKMVHFPKWGFFSENLLMSLVPFIHTYLRAKNQSQILMY